MFSSLSSSPSDSSPFSFFVSVPSVFNSSVKERGKDAITERTLMGGFLSMMSLFICSLLFFYEIYRYFSIDIESHVSIDSLPLTNKIVPIHYAISFPYVACRDLTLNAESIGAEDYSHFYTIDDMDGDVVEVFKEAIDTRKVIDAYNHMPQVGS